MEALSLKEVAEEKEGQLQWGTLKFSFLYVDSVMFPGQPVMTGAADKR